MPVSGRRRLLEEIGIDPNSDYYLYTKHRPIELFWVQHRDWLAHLGYRLRPRLQAGWKASFTQTLRYQTFPNNEDAQVQFFKVMDAINQKTGRPVALKPCSPLRGRRELAILQYLNSKTAFTEDPRNCYLLPLASHEVPNDLNTIIIVFPFMYHIATLPFETVGEVIACLTQLFEGLQLLHEQGIAHRDIKYENVMMDLVPLAIDDPHPVTPQKTRDYRGFTRFRGRTSSPVKYYIIDFDLADKFDLSVPARCPVGYGGIKYVPEFQTQEECDPFPVDVYCMGDLVEELCLKPVRTIWGISNYRGLEFLVPLVADMTQDDPTKRPTMSEVVSRMSDMRSSLSPWTLRYPVLVVYGNFFQRTAAFLLHWCRHLLFAIKGYPAVPMP